MKKILMLVGAAAFCLAAGAMPTKSELKGVQGLVNELMAGDMQAKKAGRMDANQVAANAEKYASEANTEAAKFLLLKGAFGLYMQGGSYNEALRVLNDLTAEVKDVPDKVLSEIVFTKLKRLSKSEGAAVFEYYERLEKRMRLTEERAKLEKSLKAGPESKDLNREMAVCLVGLGDWSGAMPYFVKAGGKEGVAAAAETKGVKTAADLWWDAAAAESRDDYRAHAAALYRKAVADGTVTGLKLALAKKRIAEVAPAEEPPVPAARPERKPENKPSATAEKPSPATAAPPPSRPVAVRGLKPLVVSLGKDVRPIEFVPIPAGKAEVGLPQSKGIDARATVTITRPFLMAKLPVVYAQWEAVMGRKAWLEGQFLGIREKGVFFKALGGAGAVAAAVVNVDAEYFFKKLNADYAKALPSGMVFRQPTLAEYEYVERAGRKWDMRKADQVFGGLLLKAADFAWYREENLTMGNFLRLLRAKGALPGGEEIVDDVNFCRERFRPASFEYGIDWMVPVGTKKPNPFGVCDLVCATHVLDRFDVEAFPPGKNAFKFVTEECDRTKAGKTDPLHWADGDIGFYLSRRSFRETWVNPPRNGLSTIRVVIGPDLAGEWKARSRK